MGCYIGGWSLQWVVHAHEVPLCEESQEPRKQFWQCILSQALAEMNILLDDGLTFRLIYYSQLRSQEASAVGARGK